MTKTREKPRFTLIKYQESMYTYWDLFDTHYNVSRAVFTERTKAVKVLQAANNGNYKLLEQV